MTREEYIRLAAKFPSPEPADMKGSSLPIEGIPLMATTIDKTLTPEAVKSALEEYGKMMTFCDNCIYWQNRPIEDAPRNAGYCLRYPPRPNSNFLYGQWPITLNKAWCGEHKMAADLDE